MMQLSDVAQATGGRQVGADVQIEAVGSDTRVSLSGHLFVALRGDRFDGHDYLAQAVAAGAVAALVDSRDGEPAPDLPLPVVVVDDTRRALGRLAAWWRTRFDLPLIGVTGSNGKTTVKEMCAAILRMDARAAGCEDNAILATQGNLNNDIGMPMMILRLTSQHRAAVLEMGMNQPGEIGYLASIARPTVALVNNAQRAHLAGMGGLAEVAVEKGAIYSGLGPSGVAVVNVDDPHADHWVALNTGRTVIRFGLDKPADVSARVTNQGLGSLVGLRTPQGEREFLLRVPGQHNVRNACAAAAACLAAGVSLDLVVLGLSQYAGTKGRLQVRTAERGATLLDDTYNANPDSVRAGLEVLAMTPGRKVFVFGDMGEIGDRAAEYHDEVGGFAKSQGIDMLFAFGEHTALAARNFGEGGAHFDSVDTLLTAIRSELGPNTVVLVKGSRFMKMERVTDAIAVKD